MDRTKMIEACAAASHEANRIYCATLGDLSQLHWEDAPAWQQDSAKRGVEKALGGATPGELHESWCAVKRADGWVHGSVKDPDLKTHPCLVPYGELPAEQREKDGIYQKTVLAMAVALGWAS